MCVIPKNTYQTGGAAGLGGVKKKKTTPPPQTSASFSSLLFRTPRRALAPPRARSPNVAPTPPHHPAARRPRAGRHPGRLRRERGERRVQRRPRRRDARVRPAARGAGAVAHDQGERERGNARWEGGTGGAARGPARTCCTRFISVAAIASRTRPRARSLLRCTPSRERARTACVGGASGNRRRRAGEKGKETAPRPTAPDQNPACPPPLPQAHGTAVGLPSDDDMGNSEVGHNALGEQGQGRGRARREKGASRRLGRRPNQNVTPPPTPTPPSPPSFRLWPSHRPGRPPRRPRHRKGDHLRGRRLEIHF